MPTHWLNLYQRPAQGSAFLARHPAFNYRHRVSAVGGFDTASCDLKVSRTEAERFLETALGCRVAMRVDNPAAPVWEGYVNRITYQYGAVSYTISLDEVANQAVVISSDVGVLGATTTTVANNTASQAIYGVIGRSLDGLVTGNANATHKSAIRDKYLSQYAYPVASAQFGGNGVSLRVECLGFYHTLDHDLYASTTTTDGNASTVITEIVQGNSNGVTFFDDTDVSLIAANATFQISRESRNGMSRWQFMKQIQEAGDGQFEWIMGITPTNPTRGARYFYYSIANSAVEYTARLSEGLSIIRNAYGARVNPWDVRPDRSIRIVDALPGWNLPGDDPREVYIQAVDYDAERGTVTFTGEDDTTLDGVMRIKRVYKKINRRFGAPLRPLG